MSKLPIALPLSLLAVIGAGLGPAQAVVTRVGNNYIERDSHKCSSGPGCTLEFTVLPAGTILDLRAVSCNWKLGGSSRLKRISLQQRSKADTLIAFQDHPISSAEQSGEAANIAIFNDQFGMIFGPGTQPQIKFTTDSGAGIDLECTIAGTVR